MIANCAAKLKPYLIELSQSTGTSLSEFGDVVTSICQENSGGIEQKDTIASIEKVVCLSSPVFMLYFLKGYILQFRTSWMHCKSESIFF